jgi:hypothetical protein
MAFDMHSKVETFEPFPEKDINDYLKRYDMKEYDYMGVTRSYLRGNYSAINSEGEATNRT